MKKKHFFIIIFLSLICVGLLNLANIPNNFFAIDNGKSKIREIAATPYPKIKVIPTGNLIGLKLYTKGVLVIGTSEIKGIDGIIQKPFEKTSIEEGDIIIELDNTQIDSSNILKSIINNSEGRELEIKYLKNGEERLETIKPVKTNENEYKLINTFNGKVYDIIKGKKIFKYICRDESNSVWDEQYPGWD